MLQLLERICSDLSSAPMQEQLLFIREWLILSLLLRGQSCFRGFNAGAVHLVLPTGGGALPYPS